MEIMFFDRDGALMNTPLTVEEIQAFTQGDCWAFALEVHRRYRYPVAAYATYDSYDDGSSYASQLGWVHVFNALPNGKYFDVLGVHSEEEIIQRWELFFTVDELESWTGIYVATDNQDIADLLDDQERCYPDVDVDDAVDKAHANYLVNVE